MFNELLNDNSQSHFISGDDKHISPLTEWLSIQDSENVL